MGKAERAAFRADLERVFQEHAQELILRDDDFPGLPENALVSRWYVVVEWAGTDGKPYLTHQGDENGAMWQHVGMLRIALQDVELDAYNGPVTADDEAGEDEDE